MCRSPIAGIVIKTNAQVGQQLQANDLLLVLEAMKMETNVTAPVAGKVKKLHVAAGRRRAGRAVAGGIRIAGLNRQEGKNGIGCGSGGN